MHDAGMGKCVPSTTDIAATRGGNAKCPKSERQEDRLLPNIPNAITLEEICTKLPWKAFYILSSVSPAWRQAIQSHRVYQARVRRQTTDTLIVHNHYLEASSTHQVVALYSTKDKRCFELPPIPGVERGIPWSSECVSMDGKIYILGGAEEYDLEEEFEWQSRSMVSKKYASDDDDDEKEVYKEVYVLDLAGQRQWRRCESMHEGRHRFASGVMNGKIHAFGGAGPSGPVNGSEAYDPMANAWSPIKPMPCQRFGGSHVVTLGEEICVYGGVYFDGETAEYAKNHEYNNHEWIGYDFNEEALNLEVFHPMKDEWRVVEPFLQRGLITRTIFDAQGILHKITSDGISIYVNEKSEWEFLHKNSFAAIRKVESTRVVPCAATVVDDVLFAGVGWERHEGRHLFDITVGMSLLEGRGLGSQNEVIEWQIISNCRCDFEDFMHAMQL